MKVFFTEVFFFLGGGEGSCRHNRKPTQTRPKRHDVCPFLEECVILTRFKNYPAAKNTSASAKTLTKHFSRGRYKQLSQLWQMVASETKKPEQTRLSYRKPYKTAKKKKVKRNQNPLFKPPKPCQPFHFPPNMKCVCVAGGNNKDTANFMVVVA